MVLADFLHPGDGVLDIGANVGAYARHYASVVGPTGSVLAVEPDPEVAAICRERAEGYPQITVLAVAVSDHVGQMALHRDASDRRRNSLWAENVVDPSGESVEVDVTTLDALAAQVPNLRGIKIDAQGAEVAILAAASQTLQNPALTWQIELWPVGLERAGASVAHVTARLEAHGWQPVGGTWPAVHAQMRRCEGPNSSLDVVIQHRDRAA